MKRSNQLILLLLGVVFLGIFASSQVLKSEYENIDKNNIYHNYTREELQNFSKLSIEGNYPGLVQIQQGDSFEIRTLMNSPMRVEWKQEEDALQLSIKYPEQRDNSLTNYAFNNERAGVYITTPTLSSLYTSGVSCRLKNWKQDSMIVSIQGKQRGLLLKESNIQKLHATIAQGGLLLLEADNHIMTAHLSVLDSSTLYSEHEVIDSLHLKYDEHAILRLSGKLIRQLQD